MASSPFTSKSQPLHNFDLSLKWNNNNDPKPINHRRRSVKSPSRIGLDSVNRSPVRVDSKKPDSMVKTKGVVIGQRKNHSENHIINLGFGVESLKSFERDSVDGFEKKPLKGSSKIVLKLPACKNNNKIEETTNEKPLKVEINDDKVQDEGNIDSNIDDEAKSWNLRPRRPLVRKCANNVDGVAANGSDKFKNQPTSGENVGRAAGEKEKQRVAVNVSLTKEEIDEDMFAFTGAKASRRPKKRHRNVQKKLDYLFPGLGLVSITPDTYKVTENSTKG